VRHLRSLAEDTLDQTPKGPTWLELESVIPLESTNPETSTVKKITTLSADTIGRKYPNLIIRLSAKRVGMKLRNALAIASNKAI
jgi:hypothetical protein